jgi:hypothetical protein
MGGRAIAILNQHPAPVEGGPPGARENPPRLV